MAKTIVAFNGVSPEVRFKLKLLSAELNIPMYRLLEVMTEEFWEKNKDRLTDRISPQKAGRIAGKILKRL